MSLTPNARGGHEEESSKTDAEEVVPGQEGHSGERSMEDEGEREGVCGEDRGQRCRDDGKERQDEEDEVALP